MNKVEVNSGACPDNRILQLCGLFGRELKAIDRWRRNNRMEREMIERQTRRKRKMLRQLETSTIQSLAIELKSSLRVPR